MIYNSKRFLVIGILFGLFFFISKINPDIRTLIGSDKIIDNTTVENIPLYQLKVFDQSKGNERSEDFCGYHSMKNALLTKRFIGHYIKNEITEAQKILANLQKDTVYYDLLKKWEKELKQDSTEIIWDGTKWGTSVAQYSLMVFEDGDLHPFCAHRILNYEKAQDLAFIEPDWIVNPFEKNPPFYRPIDKTTKPSTIQYSHAIEINKKITALKNQDNSSLIIAFGIRNMGLAHWISMVLTKIKGEKYAFCFDSYENILRINDKRVQFLVKAFASDKKDAFMKNYIEKIILQLTHWLKNLSDELMPQVDVTDFKNYLTPENLKDVPVELIDDLLNEINKIETNSLSQSLASLKMVLILQKQPDALIDFKIYGKESNDVVPLYQLKVLEQGNSYCGYHATKNILIIKDFINNPTPEILAKLQDSNYFSVPDQYTYKNINKNLWKQWKEKLGKSNVDMGEGLGKVKDMFNLEPSIMVPPFLSVILPSDEEKQRIDAYDVWKEETFGTWDEEKEEETFEDFFNNHSELAINTIIKVNEQFSRLQTAQNDYYGVAFGCSARNDLSGHWMNIVFVKKNGRKYAFCSDSWYNSNKLDFPAIKFLIDAFTNTNNERNYFIKKYLRIAIPIIITNLNKFSNKGESNQKQLVRFVKSNNPSIETLSRGIRENANQELRQEILTLLTKDQNRLGKQLLQAAQHVLNTFNDPSWESERRKKLSSFVTIKPDDLAQLSEDEVKKETDKRILQRLRHSPKGRSYSFKFLEDLKQALIPRFGTQQTQPQQLEQSVQQLVTSLQQFQGKLQDLDGELKNIQNKL